VVAPARLPQQFIDDVVELRLRPYRNGNGHIESATTEQQQEFRDLMARIGIHPNRPDRNGQDKVLCPGHTDTKPSLSVNWILCVLNCLGPGEISGGLNWLREYVDGPSIRMPKPVTPSRNGSLSKPLPKGYQQRLEEAVKDLAGLPRCREGTDWPQAVRDCHKRYRAGKCTECGRRPAFAISCGFPLCVECLVTRLAYDWNQHAGAWPESMSVYLLTPQVSGDRKPVGSRFSELLKRAKIAAGVYGVI